MISKILCTTCAFKLQLENNPAVVVMSKAAAKKDSLCHWCDERVGHSKDLDRLIGVYHQARHERQEQIDKQLELVKKMTLKERFDLLQTNHYNGDTLSCFIMAIRGRGYTERTIKHWFNKLVEDRDCDMFNRIKLFEELVEISNPKQETA